MPDHRPLTDPLTCNARIMPHGPDGHTRYCERLAGHAGDHEANPSNPYRWDDTEEGAVSHDPSERGYHLSPVSKVGERCHARSRALTGSARCHLLRGHQPALTGSARCHLLRGHQPGVHEGLRKPTTGEAVLDKALAGCPSPFRSRRMKWTDDDDTLSDEEGYRADMDPTACPRPLPPGSARSDGRMCQCGAGVVGDPRETKPICADGLCWTNPDSDTMVRVPSRTTPSGDQTWPGDSAGHEGDAERRCNAVSSVVVGSHSCEREAMHDGSHEAAIQGALYCWYDEHDTLPHVPGLPRPLPGRTRIDQPDGWAGSDPARRAGPRPPRRERMSWGGRFVMLTLGLVVVYVFARYVRAVDAQTDRMVRCVETTEALGTGHDDAVRICAGTAR